MSETANPFLPGARVAIKIRHSDGYAEGFVGKVYKTGRFTLRGSARQWRPERPSQYREFWSAVQTGESYYRNYLKIWDDTTDAEIRSERSKAIRQNKWLKLIDRIKSIRFEQITDELVSEVEAAINKTIPIEPDRPSRTLMSQAGQ